MAETKTCSRCDEAKPRSEFRIANKGYPALRGECKACEVEYRRNNVEKTRAARRRWYSRNSERMREARRQYVAQNPEKVAAQHRLNHEVEKGRMHAPDACERCGETELKIQAHHADYAKPLEVDWLCARCHWVEHSEVAA